MGRERAWACYRELGAELRKRRVAANLSSGAIAEYTGWDRSKVSRVESGLVGISVVDVLHYLGACRVFSPAAQDLVKLCQIAERRMGYWLSDEATLPSLVFHESRAAMSTVYHPMLVPGLLQVPDYAETLIGRAARVTEEEIAAYTSIRLERQRILHRTKAQPVQFYVHEQALHLEIGGSAVMHEQMLHLALIATLPNVTVRIVPAAARERSYFGGPFQLYRFDRHDPLVYLDLRRTGMFLEGKRQVAEYAEMVPDLTAVALDEHDTRRMLIELADHYDRRNQRERITPIYS